MSEDELPEQSLEAKLCEPVGLIDLPGSGHFNNLPTELLFYITSMLDFNSTLNLGSTCAQFYAITHDPLSWSRLTWKSSWKSDNMVNVIQYIKSYKSHLKYISLTSNAMPLLLSGILPQLFACKCLQSISLTNFSCTLLQVTKLLQLPALSELHLLAIEFQHYPFKAVASSKCKLKVLSIPTNCFDFAVWARYGFAPTDLRVLLSKVRTLKEFNTAYEVGMHSIVNYVSPSPFPKKARLSFFEPTADFFSLSSVPFIQFCFTPPNVKPILYTFPSGSDLFPLTLIEDVIGSQRFSSAVTLHPNFDTLHFDASCGLITSLKMFCEYRYIDAHLQTVAARCPNLVRLDLQHSQGILIDLNGLNAIALSCTKLSNLNIATDDSFYSIDSDRLWQEIGRMSNLKSLKIPCSFIPSESDHVAFPTLEAISIVYQSSRQMRTSTSFTDKHFDTLTSMPSLSYFRFESIPSITVFSGLTNIMHSYSNLTRLFIMKYPGNKLIFPLDYSCYKNLEKMYIDCDDFIFSDELANTISKCKHMKVLALKISSITVTAITTMFDSFTSLMVFIVQTTSHTAFRSVKMAEAFSRCLIEKSKSQGRITDVQIISRCDKPLMHKIQLHLHFDL